MTDDTAARQPFTVGMVVTVTRSGLNLLRANRIVARTGRVTFANADRLEVTWNGEPSATLGHTVLPYPQRELDGSPISSLAIMEAS